MDNAWQELAEQKRINAANQAKTKSLIQEAEAKMKRDFDQQLSLQAAQAAEREAMLSQTIQELRTALNRANEQAAWKEEEFTNEIKVCKHFGP